MPEPDVLHTCAEAPDQHTSVTAFEQYQHWQPGDDPQGFQWRTPGIYIQVSDTITGFMLAEVRIDYPVNAEGRRIAEHLARSLQDLYNVARA